MTRVSRSETHRVHPTFGKSSKLKELALKGSVARALLCSAAVMLNSSCLVTDFAVDPEENSPLVVATENVVPELTNSVPFNEVSCPNGETVEFDARSAVSDADPGDVVSALWRRNGTQLQGAGGTGQAALRVTLTPCDYKGQKTTQVALFITDRAFDQSTTANNHPKDVEGRPATLIQWTIGVLE